MNISILTNMILIRMILDLNNFFFIFCRGTPMTLVSMELGSPTQIAIPVGLACYTFAGMLDIVMHARHPHACQNLSRSVNKYKNKKIKKNE